MKKMIVVTLCGIFLLTGCTKIESESVESESVEIESITFDLVSDHDTGIIYINNHIGGAYVYTPYYSKNGKLCRYVDGKIVEIEAEE